jgi:Short C-terminal domain
MLNPNEEVFVVARQSRLKPGGSKLTPNVVFATDRRIIIRDPSMLGLREDSNEEGIITAIPKDKSEGLLKIIRNGMDKDREVYRDRQEQPQPQQSVADEMMKLANLKEKGVISGEEFQQMKEDLIKKKV